MLVYIALALALVFALLAAAVYRHQRLLRDRALLMREGIRHRDFMFRLPTRGLLFGERALQQTLNDMGQEIEKLIARNEVEAWQRLTRVLPHEIMNATAPIQAVSQAYLQSPQIKGSPYEEGITILSKDSEGRPYLAFLPKTLDGSTPEFFDYDCLTTNNSDTHFASNPSDLVQSAGTLIFCCQGNGTDSDVPTIYYLNEKTLVVENMLRVTEYPDFQPTILGIPSMDASGVAYPILCANGKTYEFSTTEGAIVKPTKLQYTYAQDMIVRDNGSGWNYELLVWDKEIGGLAQIYNGYGPYYCSKNYHQTRATCTGTNNYFDGRKFCKMTYIRMTPEQASTNDHQCLVITNNGMLVQKTILSSSFWTYNFDTSETVRSDNGGSTIACVGQSPVTETTPTIANRTYFSLLFGDGNKVRRWNYTTSQLLSDAGILQTVGTDDAVITGFEMSADHKRTYVAFYEPKQTGRNGSMWVIDTDKGDIIEKYDNICHMPVKIIYKKK